MSPARSRRRLWGVAGAGVLVVIAVACLGSDHATALYWNKVHALACDADAVKLLDTPAAAIASLEDIEHQLDGLSTADVDPRALDAANGFRVAVVAARECIATGQRIKDHPVRTSVGTAVGVVTGGGPLKQLRDELAHVRSVTVQAHATAVRAHSALAWRYPISRFKSPIPPDTHLIDALIHELDQVIGDQLDASERAFNLGRVIGALLALL